MIIWIVTVPVSGTFVEAFDTQDAAAEYIAETGPLVYSEMPVVVHESYWHYKIDRMSKQIGEYNL